MSNCTLTAKKIQNKKKRRNDKEKRVHLFVEQHFINQTIDMRKCYTSNYAKICSSDEWSASVIEISISHKVSFVDSFSSKCTKLNHNPVAKLWSLKFDLRKWKNHKKKSIIRWLKKIQLSLLRINLVSICLVVKNDSVKKQNEDESTRDVVSHRKYKIRRNYFTQYANGNQMNETSFALLFFYYCSKKNLRK